MNKQKLLIIALIFPILVCTLLWGNAVAGKHVGQQNWQIKMAGYDPRDLLYGHYLLFRYEWNVKDEKSSNEFMDELDYGEKLCLCLNKSDLGVKNPIAKPIKCRSPERKQCQSSIKVFNYGDGFSLTRGGMQEKYFIPEERASDIDRLFAQDDHDFYMDIMAHKSGQVSVRQIYIGEQTLEEYLRRN